METIRISTVTDIPPFVRNALLDFGLADEFAARPPLEQRRCIEWIGGAGSEAEEEARVSIVLDALWSGISLPGALVRPDRSP